MLKYRLLAALIFSSITFNAAAHSGKPHVHGQAQLLVAIEAQNVEIEFESPLENLVGFERAPRNEKERAALADMEKRLLAPQSLVRLPENTQCAIDGAELVSPFPASASGAAASQANTKDAHSDVQVSLKFKCAKASDLRTLEISAFHSFSRIHKVTVQVVSPQGQRASTHTSRQRQVKW